MIEYLADGVELWLQLAAALLAAALLMAAAWVVLGVVRRVRRFWRAYRAVSPGKRAAWLSDQVVMMRMRRGGKP